MRRFVGMVALVLALCAGCTGSDSGARPVPTSTPSTESLSLASLDLGWPTAQERLDVGEPPSAPAGFDDVTYARMTKTLAGWARTTTVDTGLWHSSTPLDQVADVLPAATTDRLREQTEDTVSPRLAVANVFADTVTVVGSPQVTTAWQVSEAEDDDGEPYVVLQLQTRAAYEVRVGNGPPRVIGVLRVHGLSAYTDTTDDFGVSGGWQEFGASDCSLPLDDELVPDGDLAETRADLRRFAEVGDGASLEMPPLDSDERVDDEYLQRCRQGQV